MNLDTTLKEFGEQFNEALKKRVEAEASETFRMKDAPLVPRTEFPSEVIFCGIYSRVKVRAFQKELNGVTYCAFHRRDSKDGVQRYVIQDKSNRCRWRNPLGTFYHVARRPSTGTIKCQCKNFEFTGILCRHIVCVFFNENIEHVPEKYIVERWRRDIPRNYLQVPILGTTPEMLTREARLYNSLLDKFKVASLYVMVNPILAFEMEGYLKDVGARGKAMALNDRAVEGEQGLAVYKARRGTVCPHTVPVPSHISNPPPSDALVAGLLPGCDPTPVRGPGRIAGRRRGYYRGGSSRGGRASCDADNNGAQSNLISEHDYFFGDQLPSTQTHNQEW